MSHPVDTLWPMPGFELVPFGTPARLALAVAVSEAKADDLLAPVTVAVPSAYAGLALRRALARPGPGFVNVRFLVLAQIGELLGAPRLAAGGRRPLTGPLRTEAIRAVLTAARGSRLASVARHPATIRSVDGSFRQLARLDRSEIDAIARRGPIAASVVMLFDEFRTSTVDYYDEEDLLGSAVSALADSHQAATELGTMILFLPDRLSPAGFALCAALASGGALGAVIGLTGDAVADTPARALASRLEPLLGAPIEQPATRAHGATIVSAPDPDDEVRAVARRVIAAARAGTPLHRLAITYRNAEPYARLLEARLDEGGVAWNGPSRRLLRDTVAGRVLHGLLRLGEADFARDAVAAWLVSGPVRDPADDRVVDGPRLDAVARAAGVVAGLDQWAERLGLHHDRLAERLEQLATRDDSYAGTRRRIAADLEATDRLAALVATLGSDVAALDAHEGAESTWSERAASARELLDRYLGGPELDGAWPDREIDALRQVRETLGVLGGLDGFAGAPTPTTFLAALDSELETPTDRQGRFGTGVFAGELRHLVGGEFDTVFVLGMVEGRFPSPARDDPLLPSVEDPAPLATSAEPLQQADERRADERRADERRTYLAALASAPARVLCFSRADPRAQRKCLPARWLLESAQILAGVSSLGAEALLERRRAEWYEVLPSFDAALRGAAEPASVAEHDLAELARWRRAGGSASEHPAALVTPALARGFLARARRASRDLTEFDGLVVGLPERRSGPVSPSALQDWAGCPFRYFLDRVLGVGEIERPEPTDTISPPERGALIHAVLEEFVRTAEPRSRPEQRWTTEERRRLAEIIDRHCDNAARRGVTGRALSWRIERRRIHRELRAWLTVDEDIRADLGVVPIAGGLELAFGGSDREAPAPEVELRTGRRVRFRGRIDRVDGAPDGSRTVVYDYKTGAAHAHHALDHDPVARGEALQLPVYALAAAALTGAPNVAAYYWFTATDADRRRGVVLDDTTLARLTDVVTTIVDGVTGGVFPARPGDVRGDRTGRETFVQCAHCAYDRLCPPDRDTAWERKRADLRAAGLVSLTEGLA